MATTIENLIPTPLLAIFVGFLSSSSSFLSLHRFPPTYPPPHPQIISNSVLQDDAVVNFFYQRILAPYSNAYPYYLHLTHFGGGEGVGGGGYDAAADKYVPITPMLINPRTSWT